VQLRTGRHQGISVSAYTGDVPGVSVWVQDESMGAAVRLNEEEAIAVIDGLREALRASQAVIAGREAQGAAQDGGPAAGS
jgi:hypothetical protein